MQPTREITAGHLKAAAEGDVTDLCPTLRFLLNLGFERRPAEYGMETVGYRFPYLDLTASDGINKYFRGVVFLSGILNTGRTYGLVEHELPRDLESSDAAAAWTSYALQSYVRDLAPLPEWMILGLGHWDLIPFVRAARDAARAYEARPRCNVDRDFARPLIRKLRLALSDLTGEAPTIFKFDGRVLSVEMDGHVFEVVAAGDAWPSAYAVTMGPETRLPNRLLSQVIEISFYNGFVHLGTSRYSGVKIEP